MVSPFCAKGLFSSIQVFLVKADIVLKTAEQHHYLRLQPNVAVGLVDDFVLK